MGMRLTWQVVKENGTVAASGDWIDPGNASDPRYTWNDIKAKAKDAVKYNARKYGSKATPGRYVVSFKYPDSVDWQTLPRGTFKL